MNSLTLGKNIKKLRDERYITQQQLADSVGVSFQAVSKWECGISLPDVMILPEIADFFDITIDELFKPNMMAYRNKAQRLMALYESNIENSEAFELAEREYKKMIAENNFTTEDIACYAYLNDCRSRYYLKNAEKYYLKAIEDRAKLKDEDYYKNQRQYILFLSRLSRAQESINRHSLILEQEPDNPMNYSSLAAAYLCANDFENAIKIAQEGLNLFPNDVILLVYAGDIYKQLSKYNEALQCWNKAFQINPEVIDTLYSKAFYLKEQGKNEEAKKVFNEIIEWNNQRGFEIENRWIKDELYKLENRY